MDTAETVRQPNRRRITFLLLLAAALAVFASWALITGVIGGKVDNAFAESPAPDESEETPEPVSTEESKEPDSPRDSWEISEPGDRPEEEAKEEITAERDTRPSTAAHRPRPEPSVAPSTAPSVGANCAVPEECVTDQETGPCPPGHAKGPRGVCTDAEPDKEF